MLFSLSGYFGARCVNTLIGSKKSVEIGDLMFKQLPFILVSPHYPLCMKKKGVYF